MDRNVVGQLLFVGKDILGTTLDPTTKALTAQIGDSTNSVVEKDSVEFVQQAGFCSRPAAATPGNASCQAVGFTRGNRSVITGTRDLRASSIYGNLKEGETCVYATTGAARILLKADGSITRYTTSDNTPQGVSISDTLGPNGWRLETPWGALVLNAQGFTVTFGGASVTLEPGGIARMAGNQVAMAGSIAAVAGSVATCLGSNCVPIPGVNTALVGAAGISGLPSPTVYIANT